MGLCFLCRPRTSRKRTVWILTEGKLKAKRLPHGATGFDLLMLPHPDLVNREDGTYLLEGSGNDGTKVLVTGENWDSLRFNTKSMNPEYFPSSYLEPVPTDPVNKDLSRRGLVNDLKSFPRSPIAYWDLERFSGVASLLRLLQE